MTHKYLYIEESGKLLCSTSRYYMVMIGSSKQANRDYLFLLAYAASHGHYFSLWSADVADFLLKVFDAYPDVRTSLHQVNARDLVRHIKAGTRPPLSPSRCTVAHHQQNNTSSSYRASSSINAKRNG